jgi:predicted enzyme related to lactoylglutathione lyase
MGLPVTWFEVMGADPDAAATFYRELLGWEVTSFPDLDYRLIDTHGTSGINGGIGRPAEGQPPYAILYAEDPDIQAVLDRAVALGATVALPVTVVPEMATFAIFVDPVGNMTGLVQGDGSIRVGEGSNPPVDWFEMASVDPARSWDFYRSLFGWEIGSSKGEGPLRGEVDPGAGTVRGGIGTSPSGTPHTTMYAKVEDLASYLERVEGLGGTVHMPATRVDEHTTIAVVGDPQGTMLGLYEGM